MEQPFFIERLSKYGIEVIVPEENDRTFIHSTIFNEFGKGIFSEETKRKYMHLIENLRSKGAEGIVLGCTEIPLLIKAGDCNTKLFDTTLIHAMAAVNFALEN